MARPYTVMTARWLPRFGHLRPRIAVAGLNPHAGEDGVLGNEDEAVIRPAVAAASVHGVSVSGPWPADTIFARASRGEFDAVVACYHDQGLIPVKLLAFGQAVNVTIGLPIIRTSVDHGTAFDIAGKNVADPGSMIEAVRLGVNEFVCKPVSAKTIFERIVSIRVKPREMVRIGNYYGPAPRKAAAHLEAVAESPEPAWLA